jgi:uncharacterized protein
MAETKLRHATFLEAVYQGDIESMRSFLKEDPSCIKSVEKWPGLTALHIAVGCNNIEMAMALVEAGAGFVPDWEGRMPSVIAAEMEVSEELADYIVEAESRALQAQGQEGV